jgi:molecular chaperone HtpG
MAKADLAQNLGTIARSGTLAFARSLAEAQAADRPSLIGQFGVGFYSAFMVADRVEVTSRRAGADEAWTWASEGQGDYTLGPRDARRGGHRRRAALKADAEEFLEPFRLQAVVRKWADHITVPIAIARDGKDEPANEGTALWRKPKPRSAGKLHGVLPPPRPPLRRALGDAALAREGALEFAALLFVPGSKPFQAVEGERDSRVRLHVRRMFITDEAGCCRPGCASWRAWWTPRTCR